MKISKGTIVRTVMLVIVIINLVLKQLGHDLINVSESEVLTVLEMLIELAVIVVSFWKNNSYSEKAIKADEFLNNLREMDNEKEVEMTAEMEEEFSNGKGDEGNE